MKNIKQKTSTLMIAFSLLLLSSCGISWENYDQAADGSNKKSGIEVSFNSGKKSQEVNLRTLSFNSPQRPLNFSTKVLFNFSDHESSLNGTTIEVRHTATGRRMFKGEASLFVGESFSFSIPTDLMGEGSRDYQVVQSSDNDEIVTSFSIGEDNKALYVFQ
jgi:hypothetical protein